MTSGGGRGTVCLEKRPGAGSKTDDFAEEKLGATFEPLNCGRSKSTR